MDQSTDVDALAAYWDTGGRSKDLHVLLASLARVPGGVSLDLAHLLPPLPRKLIYTYPRPANDPLSVRRDCHWTSLNFLNDPPDDRFVEPDEVKKAVETEYHPVGTAPRFGDIVFIRTARGELIHSSVYLAADIVFTKNGAFANQPWIPMKIDDMVDAFNGLYLRDAPLKLVIYRRNGR